MKVSRKLGGCSPGLAGVPRGWARSPAPQRCPLRVDHAGGKISACERKFSLIKGAAQPNKL